MSKLTLSIDAPVIERAKKYTRRQGVSVSRLVQNYLAVVSGSLRAPPDPPVLRALRGTLKRASIQAYKRRLARKYRWKRSCWISTWSLDILLDPQPHVAASALAWSAVETGQLKGIVPAHGVTTIYYLVRRSRGEITARRTVTAILQVLGVATIDMDVIQRALLLASRDFEDAVTAAAAEAAGCDAIVSRDPKGFPRSPVQVLTPESAAAVFRFPPRNRSAWSDGRSQNVLRRQRPHKFMCRSPVRSGSHS